MKTLFCAVALLLTLACSAQAQQDVAGSYIVAGTNPDKSTYAGRATVTEKDGLIQFMVYDHEQSELMAVGIGLREGNVISLIFQAANGVIGLASYRIDGDTLIGRWTVPGAPDVMTETLTKSDPRLHGADQGPKRSL